MFRRTTANTGPTGSRATWNAYYYFSLFDWIVRIVLTCALFAQADQLMYKGGGHYHHNITFQTIFWLMVSIHAILLVLFPCLRMGLNNNWHGPWWLAIIHDVMIWYSIFNYVALIVLFTRPDALVGGSHAGNYLFYMAAFMALTAEYVIVNLALGYVLFFAHNFMPPWGVAGAGVGTGKYMEETKTGPGMAATRAAPAGTTTGTGAHSVV